MLTDLYDLNTFPNKEQDATQHPGDSSNLNQRRAASADPAICLSNSISELTQTREASEPQTPTMAIDGRDYSGLADQLAVIEREAGSDKYLLVPETGKTAKTLFAGNLRDTHNNGNFSAIEEIRPRCHGWANREANHKRAPTVPNLNNLEEHHPQFHERNTTSEHALHDRLRIGEPNQGTGKRSRRPLPPAHYVDVTVEHEASAMSGRSPGTRKRKQHSSSKEPVDTEHRPDDPASFPTPADEIADSDVSFENEGEAVKSKRIRLGFGAKLKQHSSDTDALNSTKDQPPAYAHRNACDSGRSLESKDAPKKPREPWGPSVRYRNSAVSSLPDYSRPQDHAHVPVESPVVQKMRALPSGPKPVNRLRNNHPPSIQPQPFNLFEEHARPHKRQKTEIGSIHINGLYPNAIDLELEPSNKNESYSARSGQSHTQNSLSRNNRPNSDSGIPEYNSIESMLKWPGHSTRRRSGTSSNTQISKARVAHQPLRADPHSSPVINHGDAVNVVHGEDANDPISDFGRVDPKAFKKTTPQVIIKETCDGTALQSPPRLKLNSRGSRDSTSPPKATGQTSHHFNQNRRSRKRRNSSNSNSEADIFSEQSQLQGTIRLPNRASIKKKGMMSSNGRPESERSQDELSLPTASTVRAMGKPLLAKRDQINTLSSSSKTKQKTSVVPDASEDDESSLDSREDMIRTNLPSSKNVKSVKTSIYRQFKVLQIFSPAHKWLIQGSTKPWSLHQNRKSGVMSIFDHEDNVVPDLGLTAGSIHRIKQSKDDGKLIILKSVDQAAKGAPQIFLELGSREENEDFCANLKDLIPNVGVLPQDLSTMVKTFDHMQKGAEFVMKQARKAYVHDPVDVQPQKRRPEAKKPPRGQRISDRMTIDDGDAGLEVRPNTGVRKTRSSDTYDADIAEPPRQRKVSSIAPAGFFGSSNVMAHTGNPHVTRSLARTYEKEPTFRQSPKERSPSPERWTIRHPDWGMNWHSSIIYPRVGKNKATVDKQDILRLDEGEFLNDNLIIFYLRWLEHNLGEQSPDLAKRVYFHNTFFYERLTKQPARGKRGINYEAVERWTAKVDLLSYDYIIVPVNENAHWYVAIICNAPKLLSPEPETVEDSQSQEKVHMAEKGQPDMVPPVRSSPNPSPQPSVAGILDAGVNDTLKKMSLEDDTNLATDDDEWPEGEPLPRIALNKHTPSADLIPVATPEPKSTASAKKAKRRSYIPAPRRYNPKAPRIITLDSLGLRHSPTCINLKEYLIAEIKSKHGVDIDIPGPLGMTAGHIPQQNNFCDCGLFLLNYIEQFLQRPDDFVECILQSREDLSIEWPKASETRIRIRELLLDLQKDQVANAENLQQTKGKGKKVRKLESNRGVGVPAKSGLIEASKSARPSAEPSLPNNTSMRLEIAEEEEALWERSTKPESPEHVDSKFSAEQMAEPEQHECATRRPSPEVQPKIQPAFYELVTKSTTPEEQAVPESVKLQKQPDAVLLEIQDTQADRTDSSSSFISNLKSGFRMAFYGHQKDTSRTEEPRPGRSPSDAVEILDSPEASHSSQFLESPSPSRRRATPRTAISHERVRSYSRLRERRPTPHPGRRRPSTEPEAGQDQKEILQTPPHVKTDSIDSSPLEPAPIPASQLIDMTGDDSRKGDEDEMIPRHGNYLAPALLSSLPNSSPEYSAQENQPALEPSRESMSNDNRRQRPHTRQKVFDPDYKDLNLEERRDVSGVVIIGQWGQRHTLIN